MKLILNVLIVVVWFLLLFEAPGPTLILLALGLMSATNNNYESIQREYDNMRGGNND